VDLFQKQETRPAASRRRMTEQKFVDRFESAVIEFAILNRATTMNEITPDQVYQNLPKGGYTIDRQTVVECFDTLVEDGHLQKTGDKYRISDDGREDVQKLQPLALEIPQLVQKGGQTQRPGMQQTTTGSAMGGQTGNVGSGPSRSNVGGTSQGNVGGNAQNRGQNR